MLFSSLSFLYFFLPVTLLAVWAARSVKAKNAVLLAASLFFFAWGAPKFAFVLVAGCLVDYALSKRIAGRGGARPAQEATQQAAALPPPPPAAAPSPLRRLLRRTRSVASDRAAVLCAVGVVLNLALLAYFKYANFAVEQVNILLRVFGGEGSLVSHVALPLGISFFTFQKISYLVDVRRGVSEPAESFAKYLLYILLFPQLILGPIIRYHDIERQFDDRTVTPEDFHSGFWRFSLGLARKMLIAGPLATVADTVFSAGAGDLSAPVAWIGIVAYTFQIYFDFAGYSDMAVGIGRMLGFRFPENFNAPYVSRDMAEFWRRWHITLGGFMKEYLYIPLGGNRCSKPRALFNNWLVFLCSGFWHGASWNFVIWGAWHGFWITVAKLLGGGKKKDGKFAFRSLPAVAATFLLVMLGWVFFRMEHFGDAVRFIRTLFSFAPAQTGFALSVTPQQKCAFAVAAVAAFVPVVFPKAGMIEWRIEGTRPGEVLLRAFLSLMLVGLSTMPLLLGGFNPFIYFKF